MLCSLHAFHYFYDQIDRIPLLESLQIGKPIIVISTMLLLGQLPQSLKSEAGEVAICRKCLML